MINEEQLNQFFFMMLLSILFIFFMVESYFAMNKPKIGHTTGIIVTLGILTSFIIFQITKNIADSKEGVDVS